MLALSFILLTFGTARSITIEDVNNLLEYGGPKCIYYYTYRDEFTTPTTDVVELMEPLSIKELAEKYNSYEGVVEALDTLPNIVSDSELVNGYEYGSGSNYINNKENKSIVFQPGTYWLASKCIWVYGDYNAEFSTNGSMDPFADLCVRTVVPYGVTSCRLSNDSSTNEFSSGSYAIRPIVTLSADLTFTKDETTANTWNI